MLQIQEGTDGQCQQINATGRWWLTFKLRLGRVLKVLNVSAHHFPVDDEVALLVNHVGYHKHLHRAEHTSMLGK